VRRGRASCDTSSCDASSYDASSCDASSYDASSCDASSCDASSYDASSCDASSYDASSSLALCAAPSALEHLKQRREAHSGGGGTFGPKQQQAAALGHTRPPLHLWRRTHRAVARPQQATRQQQQQAGGQVARPRARELPQHTRGAAHARVTPEHEGTQPSERMLGGSTHFLE
jgi:hypothetical protein